VYQAHAHHWPSQKARFHNAQLDRKSESHFPFKRFCQFTKPKMQPVLDGQFNNSGFSDKLKT
jgi:hypothetical protein